MQQLAAADPAGAARFTASLTDPMAKVAAAAATIQGFAERNESEKARAFVEAGPRLIPAVSTTRQS